MLKHIVRILSLNVTRVYATNTQNDFLFILQLLYMCVSFVIPLMLNYCERFTVILILNNIWWGIIMYVESIKSTID